VRSVLHAFNTFADFAQGQHVEVQGFEGVILKKQTACFLVYISHVYLLANLIKE
jgi:hypothetical protein